MLNVVIRTDASLHIGSGHVMRCLVLADALRAAGHNVMFLTRPQKGDLIEVITGRGFPVYKLSQPERWSTPKTTSDYAAWLQMDEIEDAEECIAQLNNIDLVVVDHYGIGIKWHKRIKLQYPCKIMVIDDLVREHSADLIIDQTLLREPSEYTRSHPVSLILTGTDYAIIHPDFAKYHSINLERSNKERQRHHVLLSMGGVDGPNATLKVLKALKRDFVEPPLTTVLLSTRAPHYQQIKFFSEKEKDWVTHIDFVENMAEFMSMFDVAIGAPGSSSWERACLGIPSILVPLAENQRAICSTLVDVGASLQLDISLIDKKLKSSYNQLLTHYHKMKITNFKLCDGLGTKRIMEDVESIFNFSLELRCAELADISLVFEWQCAPQTRRYALNKEPPSFLEHQEWMRRKLSENDNYFYVIEYKESIKGNADPVGVIRLDLTAKNIYTISIFIAPNYFGRGIAKKALALLDRLHPSVIINAVVLKENVVSQALFSGAGYIKINEEHYIRQPIE
ncbi:UDP-2,4-diacetamido-2,4,6-trideoxy-beta-L-altropyranose hydrolase [Marinomonas sp. NPDC078689]|uniref:UDP-2,4-diacetamido-2,4, 6-trideoxy-beta-L-altropyranose hydrolase n=1 Tax=Marinomonas sp. NPDC078689 TaxID=3364147 RepID=UPI0037CBE5FF